MPWAAHPSTCFRRFLSSWTLWHPLPTFLVPLDLRKDKDDGRPEHVLCDESEQLTSSRISCVQMTSWSDFGGISFDSQGRKQEGKKGTWRKCWDVKYCLSTCVKGEDQAVPPGNLSHQLECGMWWGVAGTGTKSLSSLVSVSSSASAYPAVMSGGGEKTGITALTHPRGLAWRCLYSPSATPHTTPKLEAVLAIDGRKGRKRSTKQRCPEVKRKEKKRMSSKSPFRPTP